MGRKNAKKFNKKPKGKQQQQRGSKKNRIADTNDDDESNSVETFSGVSSFEYRGGGQKNLDQDDEVRLFFKHNMNVLF